jgi:hypothetical protein
MKKIYEKPLMKDHKLLQTNALLIVNSQGDDEDVNDNPTEEDVDEGW